MGIHEGLKLVFLLELITGRETLLLLLLVEHHLLNGGASFGVKVRELGVLRLNLLSVDLWVALDDAVPPVHLVNLHQSHLKGALGAIGLKGPQAFGSLDLLVEGSFDNGGLSLDADLDGLCLENDVQVAGSNVVGKRYVESDLLKSLSPSVLVEIGTISGVWLESLIFLFAFLTIFLVLFISTFLWGLTGLLFSLLLLAVLLIDDFLSFLLSHLLDHSRLRLGGLSCLCGGLLFPRFFLGLLLCLKCGLSLLVINELSHVRVESLLYDSLGLISQSEEIGLASHEAE